MSKKKSPSDEGDSPAENLSLRIVRLCHEDIVQGRANTDDIREALVYALVSLDIAASGVSQH